MRKILIFTSEIPNDHFAGSMQLLRVFQGYPGEKLAVIGPKPPANAQLLDCRYLELPCLVQRWRNTRLHGWLTTLAVLFRWFRPSIRKARRLLREYKPEAVFTVMDNFSWYQAAADFAKENGLPLITMTMDAPDRFEKNFPWVESPKQRAIRAVYAQAERNLCVSRQMTKHIREKYGAQGETFYFGPPDGIRPRPAELSRRARQAGRFTLGFAGGMAYGYGEALARIAPRLAGSGIVIRIYSRDKLPGSLTGLAEYAGCFSHEVLWRKFQEECDASLLVYAFGHPDDDLFRTHFPTKLSEYVWQGMPLVMVGPEHATGMIWGREHPDACLVETDPELKTLRKRLEILAEHPEKRASMAAAALHAAKSEFDPQQARSRFQKALQGTGTF